MRVIAACFSFLAAFGGIFGIAAASLASYVSFLRQVSEKMVSLADVAVRSRGRGGRTLYFGCLFRRRAGRRRHNKRLCYGIQLVAAANAQGKISCASRWISGLCGNCTMNARIPAGPHEIAPMIDRVIEALTRQPHAGLSEHPVSSKSRSAYYPPLCPQPPPTVSPRRAATRCP